MKSLLTSLTSRFRPDVDFFCDIDYDPFLFMQDNKKVYGIYSSPPGSLWSNPSGSGFTISLYEYIETIPTLWSTVKGESKSSIKPYANNNRVHGCQS